MYENFKKKFMTFSIWTIDINGILRYNTPRTAVKMRRRIFAAEGGKNGNFNEI